jgi:hypothetical protein
MASLLANTRFASGVQMAFFRDRYYGGGNYFHYKTNVNMNNIMVMIEAIGYAYGGGAAIRSAWNFYAYAGSGTAISIGLQNVYGGMSAYSVYTSSDGYACICASCGSYYSGWVMNAYTLNPTGYNFNVQITSTVQSTSSSNQF